MVKKTKKKIRITQKERKVSSASRKTILPNLNPTDEIGDVGILVNERNPCIHLSKGVNLIRFSSKIGSVEFIRCKDCREDAIDRRLVKGRSKVGKKKGTGRLGSKSDLRPIWVCLECAHFACGGIGLPTTPQSYAARHAKRYGHPCVIQLDNPKLRWCFPCNSLIPVETLEDNGEQKDILLDVVKLIKGQSSVGASIDVEDVWFGGGNAGSKSVLYSIGSGILEGGYRVKGLVNLGNTCFFNSVVQNLFSIDILRDYFLKSDGFFGPLTTALKKLFGEICLEEVDSRSVINPQSFFGCICAKAPQFRGYQQQDSHELLRFLLDGLCTEELEARKLQNSYGEDGTTSNHGPTFVDAIFGGQLSSTVRCVECGHSSVVYEPCLDLSLPVPSKKSSRKKDPTVSRPRKLKLPPKKGGRTRLKEGTNFSPVFPKREPDPGPSDSNECFWLDYVEAANALEFSNECSSLMPFSMPVAEQSVASVDECFWLDYVEADDFSCLGFVQPDEVAAECYSVSQHYDTSAVQDSENRQIIENDMLQDGSGLLSQGCYPNTESNLDFYSSQSNSCEGKLPLQVQSSEVLLLPRKEENSTTEEIVGKEGEASTFLEGCEPDGLDFDGFGDLFNEPEMVPDPNTSSWSGDTSFQFQANEMTETSFVAGNNSDSSPDEVDNSDAPVSIDSCLAYFTNPELLSNEHAWHCENCSKILQGQRMEGNGGLLKTKPRTRMNGVEVRSRNAPLGFIKNHMDLTECSYLDNGKLENDTVSTTNGESFPSNNKRLDDSNQDCTKLESCQKGEETDSEFVNLDCLKISQEDKVFGLLNHITEGQTKTSDHHDSSIQTSDSCEYNRIQLKTVQAQPKDSQSSAKVCDSDDNEDEETDSKSVKVMRDATKTILINRVPPILTIHLKRFSQDSRGRLSKLSGHVSFKETIDLQPYLDPRCGEERDKCEYYLVGVVVHSGTMRGGHYIAYVRGNKNEGKTEKFSGKSTWYHISDCHVREVSPAEVLQCEAYILFYEKI